MEIKSKSYKTTQLRIIAFEHFILTFLSLLGSFIFIFFIFGRGEARSASRGNNNYQPLTYLFEHEFIYLAICIAITLFVNIYVFVIKRKSSSIYNFNFNDIQRILSIEIRSRYSNKRKEKIINYDELRYRVGKKDSLFSAKEFEFIDFYDSDHFIGELYLADLLWDKNYKAYNMIKSKLKAINAIQQEDIPNKRSIAI